MQNRRNSAKTVPKPHQLTLAVTMHMMKEEMLLFPYIVRMEESVIEKQPILPPRGTL